MGVMVFFCGITVGIVTTISNLTANETAMRFFCAFQIQNQISISILGCVDGSVVVGSSAVPTSEASAIAGIDSRALFAPSSPHCPPPLQNLRLFPMTGPQPTGCLANFHV